MFRLLRLLKRTPNKANPAPAAAVVQPAPELPPLESRETDFTKIDCLLLLMEAIKTNNYPAAKIIVSQLRQDGLIGINNKGQPWNCFYSSGNHWPMIEAIDSGNPQMAKLILDCFQPSGIDWLNKQTTLVGRRVDQYLIRALNSKQNSERLISVLLDSGLIPSDAILNNKELSRACKNCIAAIRGAIPKPGSERRLAVLNLLAATGADRARQL